MKRLIVIAALLAAALFTSGVLLPTISHGQDGDQPSRDRAIQGLVREQESAYNQFQRLEERMRELAKKLRAAGFAEKADNLEKALEVMIQKGLRTGSIAGGTDLVSSAPG